MENKFVLQAQLEPIPGKIFLDEKYRIEGEMRQKLSTGIILRKILIEWKAYKEKEIYEIKHTPTKVFKNIPKKFT